MRLLTDLVKSSCTWELGSKNGRLQGNDCDRRKSFAVITFNATVFIITLKSIVEHFNELKFFVDRLDSMVDPDLCFFHVTINGWTY